MFFLFYGVPVKLSPCELLRILLYVTIALACDFIGKYFSVNIGKTYALICMTLLKKNGKKKSFSYQHESFGASEKRGWKKRMGKVGGCIQKDEI